MDATFFALVALILFFGVIVWAKVPGKITGALDSRADAIRDELDEARRLREEAQSLLADYQRKRQEAEGEAEAIIAEAKREAEILTAETNAALEEMIARRTKAAESKIAQAESQAIAEVRARAADVAVLAAEKILTAKVTDAAADKLIADGIAEIKGALN
ncbi:F0F1 ATP synthase subunit B [Breoghania sp. L-A4]|uniref:F0F1 ATP synthase subunit B n=1 Tax=Breoghania sp. L-A4 TaxID=2304600 RepID=UPI000E35CCA8|nr:F0F1 ATP synthase subunit B [Breoghania sp. L-A4]AXS39527.1 ATP F0F1 synthase subunit B [Breoghania sp. L-A4]